MNILYEDNHLIAVEKPAGQLTQGDKSGELSLLDQLRSFIKERDNKPGNVFIGMLHRLDKPVGGVVLFAKTSKGAARISEQIREHTFEKVYEALVQGTPPAKQGRVVQWIIKDKTKFTVRAYDKPVRGGLRAELIYRVIKPGAISRVEVKPITGRPHQIRVAMASIGTPIVGDHTYGAKKEVYPVARERQDKNHIGLWATEIIFAHPITGERMRVASRPPFVSTPNGEQGTH